MTTVQAPTVWIYGGVHHVPGTRQRFLEELTKEETAPHFVAVEWEQSVFERLAAWRPWIAEGLRRRWDFLTGEDCHELSLALAWEGDAYAECFPGTDVLWLESGLQEAELTRRYDTGASTFPESCAHGLLQRLYCRPTVTAARPEPRSKQELIDRMSRDMWHEASLSTPSSVERDARWASAICERSRGLRDGWIAVVVGWEHADPQGGNQRLRGHLAERGFCVNSACLRP